jgi:squalene-hopene/tetraprenyl-beta-curcumene cyclase
LFHSTLAASELQQVANKDWRKDLVTQLTKEQRPDGSWMNDNRQWMENDPNLCTAFALLALSYCDEDAGGK